MAWEENSRICLHMQLIAILSRTGVIIPRALPWAKSFCPFRACCLYPLPWAKSIWAFSPYLNHLRKLNK